MTRISLALSTLALTAGLAGPTFAALPFGTLSFVEYFVDENWLEHQRRLERFTAFDAGLRDERMAFHLGPEPPVLRRYLAEGEGTDTP